MRNLFLFFGWRLVICLGVASVLPASGLGGQAAAQDAFFLTVSDLPLMPGLEEATESALVFDNPGGRLVEVSASGVLPRDSIFSFYGETLPQLGWVAVQEGWLEREGEVLRLVVTGGAGALLVVTFSISPLATPSSAAPAR
jgi:hypothetical protein